MSLNDIFQDFEGIVDLDSVQGSGDVRYHNGAKGIFSARSGRRLPVMMASNPSHLEAVDPVVEGMARAMQDSFGYTGHTGSAGHADRFDRIERGGKAGGQSLAVLVHGDAAFAGQGVVAETLEMSQLPGYQTGGTIHLVINNQLGFTTAPQSARSSVYPTDIAKVVQAPIFHVNGDDPEACTRAALLAFAFRDEFHKDVVIDMVCYRRHGHNEGDDPSYTQPRMYRAIDQHRPVRKLYAESLVHRGHITLEKAEELLADFNERYQRALDETRALASGGHYRVGLDDVHAAQESGITQEGSIAQSRQLPFSIDKGMVECIVQATMTVPDGFTLHPKLVRQFEKREKMLSNGIVDWVACEALAFGNHLASGNDVRLCGQDTRRGTFSQRHAVLVDYETGAEWIPLAHLQDLARNRGCGYFDNIAMGRFFTYDSLLSEYAALGFEYGYSVEALDSFVAWEAQFGDFSNGAQVMVDNFIAAAKEKWNQQSGLVMLLPHGYEGQGPEHSSARLERFLTLSANGNMRVAQPTTGAQYYHLLVSTALQRPKVPLVMITPKSLLRAQETQSNIDDIVSGKFEPVLDDPTMYAGEHPDLASVAGTLRSSQVPAVSAVSDPSRVGRVVLCTGKVAYEIMSERNTSGKDIAGQGITGRDTAAQDMALSGEEVAVVRVEQLYPWPEDELERVLMRYPNARDVMWVQEEPENMGAWAFVHGRLHRMLRGNLELYHASRPESGSPASGSLAAHKAEHAELMKKAFEQRQGA
jgi:2-oxoglutarate dehydrogenase E1 component